MENILPPVLADGKVLLWDAQSGVLKNRYAQKGSIWSVAFDPKTRWVVSTSADSTIKIFDLATSTNVKTMTEHDGICNLCGLSQ